MDVDGFQPPRLRPSLSFSPPPRPPGEPEFGRTALLLRWASAAEADHRGPAADRVGEPEEDRCGGSPESCLAPGCRESVSADAVRRPPQGSGEPPAYSPAYSPASSSSYTSARQGGQVRMRFVHRSARSEETGPSRERGGGRRGGKGRAADSRPPRQAAGGDQAEQKAADGMEVDGGPAHASGLPEAGATVAAAAAAAAAAPRRAERNPPYGGLAAIADFAGAGGRPPTPFVSCFFAGTDDLDMPAWSADGGGCGARLQVPGVSFSPSSSPAEFSRSRPARTSLPPVPPSPPYRGCAVNSGPQRQPRRRKLVAFSANSVVCGDGDAYGSAAVPGVRKSSPLPSALSKRRKFHPYLPAVRRGANPPFPVEDRNSFPDKSQPPRGAAGFLGPVVERGCQAEAAVGDEAPGGSAEQPARSQTAVAWRPFPVQLRRQAGTPYATKAPDTLCSLKSLRLRPFESEPGGSGNDGGSRQRRNCARQASSSPESALDKLMWRRPTPPRSSFTGSEDALPCAESGSGGTVGGDVVGKTGAGGGGERRGSPDRGARPDVPDGPDADEQMADGWRGDFADAAEDDRRDSQLVRRGRADRSSASDGDERGPARGKHARDFPAPDDLGVGFHLRRRVRYAGISKSSAGPAGHPPPRRAGTPAAAAAAAAPKHPPRAGRINGRCRSGPPRRAASDGDLPSATRTPRGAAPGAAPRPGREGRKDSAAATRAASISPLLRSLAARFRTALLSSSSPSSSSSSFWYSSSSTSSSSGVGGPVPRAPPPSPLRAPPEAADEASPAPPGAPSPGRTCAPALPAGAWRRRQVRRTPVVEDVLRGLGRMKLGSRLV